MKYMIIERFKPGLKQQVYERYERHGRMLPAGVHYLDSWISEDQTRCFQLMESGDPPLLESWTKKWDDLIDFEIVPVRDSPTKIGSVDAACESQRSRRA